MIALSSFDNRPDRVSIQIGEKGVVTLPTEERDGPAALGISTYNGSGQLTTVANNLGRQLNLSYSGSHVAGVSDGFRSVSYGYAGDSLTRMTDPLGNSTIYAYDTSGAYDTVGHLTQIFYPSEPGVAFVSNFYDGLGRVARQFNANGQNSTFYFAGPRSEIVDPLGDRHVT